MSVHYRKRNNLHSTSVNDTVWTREMVSGFQESRMKSNLTRNIVKLSSFQRFQLILILALIDAVTLPASGNAYTEEQQRLCNDDAMRLCSEYVPDVDRITACMQRQRALLSKECKSVFGERRHFPVQHGRARRQ